MYTDARGRRGIEGCRFYMGKFEIWRSLRPQLDPEHPFRATCLPDSWIVWYAIEVADLNFEASFKIENYFL